MTKISAQKAIANFCKGCIYDPLEKGTWREQVENCSIPHCELFEHRPRSTTYKRQQRELYLQTLSPEELIMERFKSRQIRERFEEAKKCL